MRKQPAGAGGHGERGHDEAHARYVGDERGNTFADVADAQRGTRDAGSSPGSGTTPRADEPDAHPPE
ncbi:hypothetical protein [Lentzea indica]|uniref:hypothetical protein n=1 Tax=Lentzea indica TaxID=2604800 RepID=UPI00143A0F5D|nr:hypothetical protein [Lentzea indica]